MPVVYGTVLTYKIAKAVRKEMRELKIRHEVFRMWSNPGRFRFLVYIKDGNLLDVYTVEEWEELKKNVSICETV